MLSRISPHQNNQTTQATNKKSSGTNRKLTHQLQQRLHTHPIYRRFQISKTTRRRQGEATQVGATRVQHQFLSRFIHTNRALIPSTSLICGSPALLFIGTNVIPFGPCFAKTRSTPCSATADYRGYIHALSVRRINGAAQRNAFFRVGNGFDFNSCFGRNTVRRT